MKVKFFEHVVSISPGGGGEGNFAEVEVRINEFLAENPGIRVLDVKLAALAAPIGDLVTNYGVVAVLMYDDLSQDPQ